MSSNLSAELVKTWDPVPPLEESDMPRLDTDDSLGGRTRVTWTGSGKTTGNRFNNEVLNVYELDYHHLLDEAGVPANCVGARVAVYVGEREPLERYEGTVCGTASGEGWLRLETDGIVVEDRRRTFIVAILWSKGRWSAQCVHHAHATIHGVAFPAERQPEGDLDWDQM